MESNKHIANIRDVARCITRGDYSTALSHIYGAYTHLYNEKRKIIKFYPHKNFKQIANSDCKRYRHWRVVFFQIDRDASPSLAKIQNHSNVKNREFISMTGVDLLKKTHALRSHCNMFAGLRTAQYKEDEDD
ncbi:MAG: hypothetical protein PHS42_11650 [Sulfurimonas sp.]|nr:hypothetical protein [Sulfurimonas sp.]